MGNLFQELKRRKVFRVAAVYAVVAWLLIEVTSTILPTFDAPQWVNQTIILVLVLGFPLALVLAWAFEMTPEGIKTDAAAQPTQPSIQSTDQKLTYAIFALVLLVAGIQVSDHFLFTDQQAVIQIPATAVSSQNSPVIRFTLSLSEDASLYLGGVGDTAYGRPASTSLALSNDGNLLVYAAWEEGPDGLSSRLYSRRLDQIGANPIEGTEGASRPFFSPDGAWIGFFVGASLRRVAVNGGVAETIMTEVRGAGRYGVNWGDDGFIVYGDYIPGPALSFGVYRVASSGGIGELIADPNSSTDLFMGYAHPQLLPGSKFLLFDGIPSTLDSDRAEIIAMNLGNGTHTSLLTNATNPHYVAETGHLLFIRQGSLMAVGFDPDQLVIEGDPVLVEEDVMQAVGVPRPDLETHAAQLAVSSSGHLAYVSGGVYPTQTDTLMYVPLEGGAEPLNSVSLTNFNFLYMRLSPDGERLAFQSGEGLNANIYVHYFTRDITQELNTGSLTNVWPSWSPDGKSIAFSSVRDGGQNIYRMAADGSDEQPERLAPSDQAQTMMSWSSDGVIAYLQDGDIWMLPPDGEPAPFFTSEANEQYASFSPDGKWLAYSVSGTRGSELYIRPYPGPGPAVLISGNGSRAPAWSSDGTQLYFIQANATLQRNGMMVVDINEGRPSPALPLIDPWPYKATITRRSYDVFEDGAFIAAVPDGEIRYARERYRVDELQVVLNFFEVLRQRVANESRETGSE